MLCFIKFENINEYKEIILKKLCENNKYDKFVLYLKKYIFKLNTNIYKFNKLISLSKEKHNNKYLDKLYTTNNIVETINSKLDFYLNKGITNNINFLTV